VAEPTKKKKKKLQKVESLGVVHVQASFNNTIITIADSRGNVVSWSSAGKVGFKGAKKSTRLPLRLRLRVVPAKQSIWE